MSGRNPAIDVLKSLAILTVVWIHVFPANAEPQPLVRYLHFLTRFAVPALFFASGMLAWGSRRPWSDFVRRRLPRLLGPYLVASVLALVYRQVVEGRDVTAGHALFAIATGSAFGPYYFVPVLVLGSVALRALEGAPRLLGPVALLFVLAGAACDTHPLYLSAVTKTWRFWSLRDPLRWWGYVFAGAWVAMRWTRVAAVGPWRGLAACAGAGVLWAALASTDLLPSRRVPLLGQWMLNWAILCQVLVTAARARERWPTRTVAELTYVIYLYHLFVVSWAWSPGMPPTPGRGVLVWSLAVLVPAALGWIGRRLLGERARYVTG